MLIVELISSKVIISLAFHIHLIKIGNITISSVYTCPPLAEFLIKVRWNSHYNHHPVCK